MTRPLKPLKRRSRALLPGTLILLSSLAGLVLVAPPGSFSGLSDPLAFAAVFTLFMVPGVLVAHRLAGKDLPGPALLPVGFAVSTGVFGITGVVVLILHRSLEAYLWASGAVLVVSLVAAAWGVLEAFRNEGQADKAVADAPPEGVGDDGDDGEDGGGDGEDSGGGRYSMGLLWLPLLLLCGALAFVATRRVPSDNDDIWVYLSWVRSFVGADRLALNGPYFGERVGELSRVHVNGWLLEQAALSRVSGLGPIDLVLRHLTPVLVVVAVLAVYALAAVLFKSGRAGVFCASAYALFHVVFIEPSVHNIGAELAVRVVEDKHAARFLILPVALLFAVLYVRGRGRRYLGLFAFSCWTIMVVHPVVLAPLGLCMLGFGLVHVAVEWRRAAAWMGMVALALAMSSVLVGPVLLALAAGESPVALAYSTDINSTPPEVLYAMVFIADVWRHIYVLDGGSYIMHPWLITNPVILGTYALGVPFLIPRLKRSLAARLLLGGMVVVAVTVYVPPVTTFVGEQLVGPNLIWRLAWPIPLLATITAGWVVWSGIGYAQSFLGRLGVGRGLVRALPFALAAGLVLAVAPFSAATAVELYRNHEIARTTDYDPDPVYPWIRTHLHDLQRPAVILAPDRKSTAIPAYSDSANVVSYRSEAMIQNRETLERIAGSEIDFPEGYLDSYRFFSDSALTPEDRGVLRSQEVDYLMVYAGSPLENRIRTAPGFSAVEDAPRRDYGLYEVDLSAL